MNQKNGNKATIAKGNTEEIKNINATIVAIRTKIFQHYNRLLESDKHISVETVKNSYFGISEKSNAIVAVFEYNTSISNNVTILNIH